ncbi:MAG: hypothetical protein ACAI43_24020 [Phycisphaerae bacterium]|nr:hypothetical protein [Tepidisphaeraceae bacterium]
MPWTAVNPSPTIDRFVTTPPPAARGFARFPTENRYLSIGATFALPAGNT